MRRIRAASIVGTLLASSIVVTSPVVAVGACDGAFHLESIPTPGVYSALSDVSVSAASEGWAVGEKARTNRSDFVPFAIHWDGVRWRSARMPAPRSSFVTSVVSVSSSEAWAVGHAVGEGGMIERWNGRRWAVHSFISVGEPGSTSLRAIDAVANDDIWAVGYSTDPVSFVRETLAVHWNGTSWSVVSTPTPSGDVELEAVDARAADDVWAVGSTRDSGELRTFVLHFDGTDWAIVPSIDPGTGSDRLGGVVSLGASDAWVVGTQNSGLVTSTLAERWDGSVFSVVATPNPAPQRNFLEGIDAVSSSEVYAVGSSQDSHGAPAEPIIAGWDGTSWTSVAAPMVGVETYLGAVDALPSGAVWAAGASRAADGSNRGIIVHRCT